MARPKKEKVVDGNQIEVVVKPKKPKQPVTKKVVKAEVIAEPIPTLAAEVVATVPKAVATLTPAPVDFAPVITKSVPTTEEENYKWLSIVIGVIGLVIITKIIGLW